MHTYLYVCMSFSHQRYQARLKRIVDLVTQYISNGDGSSQITQDTILTPHTFDVEIDPFATSSIKPDITIVNRPGREVFLVEVAVPFGGPIHK